MNPRTYHFEQGEVLLINKPFRWTSFDAVNKIRWMLQKKLGLKKLKVGHAGTLDPLATGLLIVCTGKFTKKIEEFQAFEKEYTGTITLGSTTPSYDLETEINARYDFSAIKEEQLFQATQQFLGEIEQVAPLYSAKKIDGVRAYNIAREGKVAEIKPNKIKISEFTLTAVRMPEVDFKIRCSKGTYIRSIAHDFGRALENGAHLSALCRTKIGDFDLKNSMEMSDFQKLILDLAHQKELRTKD
jgi:tRNA pseudouridine55 synthase